LLFDDGHSTGIFTWAYLHELGREREKRWRDYLQELSAKGLRRDP
jgi:ATP-binding protein involved in chromosome partitioning